MQADKAQTILMLMKNKIPKKDYYRLEDALFDAPDKVFDEILSCQLISIKKFTLISIFGGFFGLDRFYLKDTAFGILKILGNIFFLGTVYFADLYYAREKAKEINLSRLFDYL
ncbi:MAG: TM2 domain-containing protein [Clostridiales bacterium]|nr:TM2 domain-containing protein [Clostridiales bacterium]